MREQAKAPPNGISSSANVPASHAGTIGNRKADLVAAAMSPDGIHSEHIRESQFSHQHLNRLCSDLTANTTIIQCKRDFSPHYRSKPLFA